MNKAYKLLILIPILISGCNTNQSNHKSLSQNIDSFDMSVYTNQGDKIYSIKSPSSRYNKESNNFKLTKTTIYLFKNNMPEYIINSEESYLSNNNKLLELKGNILVKAILNRDDKLYADNFKWDINNSKCFLNGNVKFENDSILLSSNKAIFNNSKNIIEFFNPVKYSIKNNDNSYEINSENAFYNIETKSVSFKSFQKKVRTKVYF